MKSYKTKGNATDRRKGVIVRLKKQLKDGVKTANTVDFAGVKKETKVPLTDKDVIRIKKEISTLESRV